MIKVLIIIVITFFCFCFVKAQETNPCVSQAIDKEMFANKLTGKLCNFHSTDNAMCFFDNWSTGSLLMENGETITNKKLRYSSLRNLVLWMRESDFRAAVIDKEMVKSFTLYDKNNLPYAIFEKVKIKQAAVSDSVDYFLQVLASGRVTLYAMQKSDVNKSNNSVTKSTYYYLSKNNVVEKFRPGKRRLMRYLGDEKEKIKAIIKANKLKIRKESQLVSALKIYNKG